MTTIKSVANMCVGCGACYNKCPKGAISMQYNSEGFLYPKIDESKCVNCDICYRVCPVTSDHFQLKTKTPECYAAYYNDTQALQSSSGGIFSLLAEKVLDAGGYICGAAFDQNFQVEHRLIFKKTHLNQLRRSKYVQSNTKKTFKETEALLKDGKTVLFSGTPCQIAGLYAFLQKDYPYLITCEVFCHGAPSPSVWRKYLSETYSNKKIMDINFRDKKNALPKDIFNVTFHLKDEMISQAHAKQIYMLGFLRNLYLRKSCSQCLFTKVPRQADISLGDFWEYAHIDKERDTAKGISAVLINTDKGHTFFETLKGELDFLKAVNLDDVIYGNSILKEPVKAHPNRGDFFNEFQKGKENVSSLIQKYLSDRKVGILNFSSFSANNYGAGLVGYAMEKAIQKIGFIPYTINFIPKEQLFHYTERNNFWWFQQKFLNLTGLCTDKGELRSFINHQFEKFVIGSDQIVRHPWHFDFIYYLDWVRGQKTLLSYAASFGTDKLGMKPAERRYAQKCLKRFDAFSVREESGSDIMSKEFGIKNAPVVCDPTMLLKAEDYQPIIEVENLPSLSKKYIAYYFLDHREDDLKELKSKYDLIDAYRDENGQFRTFGQWLNIIKNATYVITDSFHGSVFSILFHRPFWVLTTKEHGNERLTSLMKLIGYNRIISADEVINEKILDVQMDYCQIDPRIECARKKGYDYLKEALSIPANPKKKIKKFSKTKKIFYDLLG